MPSAEQFYIDYDQFKEKVAKEQKNILDWFKTLADDVTEEVALIQEQLADVGQRLKTLEELNTFEKALQSDPTLNKPSTVVVTLTFPDGSEQKISVPYSKNKSLPNFLDDAIFYYNQRRYYTIPV